ncbi:MAG: serine/threonine-protein kinase [Acidobacteria bacterium]|nr:serine/threonine-protein kinase [Acidobacteriota bacterium]
MIGDTLGHYRIIEKLGAGGMGEVYRARDERLGRDVALKLLPEAFAADPERLARFEREARLLASLNHPHIAAIHGLEEAGGKRFLVLELVEGKTLAEELKAGSLAVGEALEVARQIADALEAAHEQGVIHRDLKPANIKRTPAGEVKLLDFGLAKALAGEPAGSDPGTSPTVSDIASREGVILGTAAYMSPEQARGKPVDKRTDIWAFGCVLYEALAGRSLFARETVTDTLAAIVEREPDWAALPAATPVKVRDLLRRCLQKDSRRRLHDIADARIEIEEVLAAPAGVEAAAPAAAPQPAWRRVAWFWAMGLLAGVVATLALWHPWHPTAPTAPPARVVQLTSLPGLEDSATWSPDGRSLAYVSDAAGNLDIYVQQIGGGRAIRLTDSEADDAQPAWSPDGTRIAFVSARAYPEKRLSALINMGNWQGFFAGRNGDVWVMPALGGSARRLAENAYYPAWSPDGKKLVYQALRDERWGLWVQEVDTDTPARLLEVGPVTTPIPWHPVISQPAWSPDGEWIAFTAGWAASLHIYAVPAEGGAGRRLTEEGSSALMPSWSPDGRWLFFSSDRGGQVNLWKARFENGRLGTPELVTAGGGAHLHARRAPEGDRLVYSSVNTSSDLWEYDLRSGAVSQLTRETTQEDNARPSPDGRWLAFSSNRLGGNHLWLMNRADGSLTQVTTAARLGIFGASHWSWDGRYLYFASEGTPSSIWQHELGLGSQKKVYEGPLVGPDIFCVSADDRYLVVAQVEPAPGIVRVELASGRAEVLARLPERLSSDPACSPDGNWVAFHVEESNDRDIWLVPLAGGEPRQLTSGPNEDSHPAWSADSRWVYFVRNHQDVWVVPREGGEPRPVTRYRSFSVTLDYPVATTDGRKLLFTRSDKAGDIYLLETAQE